MELETKQGIIISLNLKRRYGFILDEYGKQIFFHTTGVVKPDFMELKAGLPVEFFEVEDVSKKPLTRAIGVVVT